MFKQKNNKTVKTSAITSKLQKKSFFQTTTNNRDNSFHDQSELVP